MSKDHDVDCLCSWYTKVSLSVLKSRWLNVEGAREKRDICMYVGVQQH